MVPSIIVMDHTVGLGRLQLGLLTEANICDSKVFVVITTVLVKEQCPEVKDHPSPHLRLYRPSYVRADKCSWIQLIPEITLCVNIFLEIF